MTQIYITLDDLEKINKKEKIIAFIRKFFKEAFSLVFFVLIILISWVVFINFNLFLNLFSEAFSSTDHFNMSITSANKKMDMASLKWFSFSDSNNSSSDNFENLKRKNYEKVIYEKFEKLEKTKNNNDIYEKTMKKNMKSKIKDYEFDFNLLPPDSRLIVSKINLEAPIIDVNYASREKIEKADFKEELRNWVVKYPFTDNPWEWWNTLIFWHTSTYWWKKNPYWQIFSKLPQLKKGDEIKLLWEWEMYKYEVSKKLIRKPSQISATYDYYKKEWKMLSLMWCYPIWTDAKRIVVLAKRKDGYKKELSFKK